MEEIYGYVGWRGAQREMTESELQLEKITLMVRGAGRDHRGEASEEADAAAQVRERSWVLFSRITDSR